MFQNVHNIKSFSLEDVFDFFVVSNVMFIVDDLLLQKDMFQSVLIFTHWSHI